MYCLYCGNLLPSDARFCSKCGKSLIQTNTHAQNLAVGVVCPECGSPLRIVGQGFVCVSNICNYRYNVYPVTAKTTSSRTTNSVNTVRPINYAGKYGASIVKFKTITITDEGVNLNGTFIPVNEITGFQFKARKNRMTFYYGHLPWTGTGDTAYNKLFSIPMGNTYEGSVTRNGKYNFDSNTNEKTNLTFSSSDYSGFVESVWRLCSHRIMKKILEDLGRGSEVKISEYSSLFDTGVKMIKPRFFNKNEEYFYSWEDVRKHMILGYIDGKFTFEVDNVEYMGGHLSEQMGFLFHDNANILEEFLMYASKHRIYRLSELL